MFARFISISLLLISFAAPALAAMDWKIKKTEWSEADEKSYSEFVSLIGQAVEKRECSSFQSCLKHKNNPYKGSDSDSLKVYADCAKLSYVMRGYFAWKNGLPFSVANAVDRRNVLGNTGNLRYTLFGNVVTSRLNFLPTRNGSSWKFADAISTLNVIIPDATFSANFRVYFENSDSDTLFTDFYPVTVDREAIRPGTNIYDPNGHVAIVYKVTADGKIYFIDAHPDNSLTSGLFGTKFVRSNPYQGAGFKNFRPLKLIGATFDATLGSYVGGQIRPTKNSELKKFDIVQFFGTDRQPLADWRKGAFMIGGQKYDYYDYLRNELSVGNLRLNPVNEIKSLASDICQTIQDRVVAVNGAIKVGLQNNSHPDRLPENIYGTSGEWEEYSTPSRDARLKTTMVELRELAVTLFAKFNAHDPQLDYVGSDIKGDMLEAYKSVSNSCNISYTKTDGQAVLMTLDEVRSRIFDMSFDPYHCVELRWGAKNSSELTSCKDGANKKDWYAAERVLRNQIERRYDLKMNLSLPELQLNKLGLGVQIPPNVNIIEFLTN
ncbi:MAG: hypothetical protein H7Z71_07925 [Moraxellaceae bacterium]|nr:hypothetical protein [Pseudobdellovibrionaceae bacterium]